MSGKQWTIFGILVAVALGLAGLGFGAMSTSPRFSVPSWVPIIFFIAAAIALFFSLAYLVNNSKKRHEEKRQHIDGTGLLRLLDETHQEITLITKRTIDKLRDRQWQGMDGVFEDVTGINPNDITIAMQYWTLKGVAQFMSGDEITAPQEAEEWSEKMAKEIGANKNFELLATDLSLSIRHRFLDEQLKKDHTYKNLQIMLRRERDKYPDEAICNAIDSFLDHSFKVNAVWAVAEYDLVGIPSLEKTFEYKLLPGPIVLRVEDVPNQAANEMERFRNKVAVAINTHLKEQAGRVVHKK